MTYAELKSAIADYLNRSDLTSTIDTFIDQSEAEMNRKLRHKKMIKRATATCDSQYLAVPTDWLEAINVEITSNDFSPLMQMSIESLDVYRKSINNRSGQPVYFALVDDSIEVCPNPDGDYELQLTYYASIPALSDSNTTNWVSTYYPDLYLNMTLFQGSMYLMDDDRAKSFKGLYESIFEEMRMEQEKAAFGKGSLIPRRRTYGRTKKQVVYWSNN